MNTKILGTKGETKAEKYLKGIGLKLIKKNYVNFVGEIDIICFDNKTKETVFVEVKTRSSTLFGRPIEAINSHKQKKIRDCATIYLKNEKLLDTKVRFDVVEVLGDEISHIKYAFWLLKNNNNLIKIW